MKRIEILEKLTEIFRDLLDDDHVILREETSQANLEDWDSLTQVTLFAVLEDDFSINFTVSEIESCNAIHLLLDMIEGKLGSG